MLLWTFIYKFLCGHIISVLLSIYRYMFNFLRSTTLFSKTAASLCSPTSNIGKCQFLYSRNYYFFFKIKAILLYEVCSDHCFGLHFPSIKWVMMLNIFFHVFLGHLYISFREMSSQIHCPFFNWVVFWLLSCKSYLYILDTIAISDI